jgi:symplekin
VQHGKNAVRQGFDMLARAEEKSKSTKSGFNRFAASDFSKDAWWTIQTRLATRASAGLDDPDEGIKDEFVKKEGNGSLAIPDAIREGLLEYVMRDWKKRINNATSWLNEEWLTDKIAADSARLAAKYNMNGNGAPAVTPSPKQNYRIWALRILDRIIVIVEYTDKVFMRLLSEMPELDIEMLRRVKKMAEDPERVDLACNTLLYLHMNRPPVRGIVAEVAAELWRENDRAKVSAGKLLKRWNPAVLQEEANGAAGDGGEVKMEGSGLTETHSAPEVKAAS